MTDYRYDFLGGKHNLQLLLGAEDFWESPSGSYGFNFYSDPLRAGFNVVFQSAYIGAFFYLRGDFESDLRSWCRSTLFEPYSLTAYNKFKWFESTRTRLDLL
jgi:hypothetical protein